MENDAESCPFCGTKLIPVGQVGGDAEFRPTLLTGPSLWCPKCEQGLEELHKHADLLRRLSLLREGPAVDRFSRQEAVVSVHKIFLDNHRELYRYLQSHEGDVLPRVVADRANLELVLQEVTRLFHNYLAASWTLRKCTDSLVESAFRRTPQAKEYEAETRSRLDSNILYAFVSSLRGYCQHYTLPVVVATFTSVGDQPWRMQLILNAKDLRRHISQWRSAAAARFLGSLPERERLGVLVRDYFILVRGYYRWFERWVDRAFGPEVEEYNRQLGELRAEFLAAGLADPVTDD